MSTSIQFPPNFHANAALTFCIIVCILLLLSTVKYVLYILMSRLSWYLNSISFMPLHIFLKPVEIIFCADFNEYLYDGITTSKLTYRDVPQYPTPDMYELQNRTYHHRVSAVTLSALITRPPIDPL